MSLKREQVSKQSQTEKGKVNTEDGFIHLEGVDPDRDITNSTAHRRIVPVSDEIKNELTALSKKAYIDNNGMSVGEEKAKLINNYLKTVPSKERSATAWTLNQHYMNSSESFRDKIRETNPTWNSGQSFDTSVLDNFPPKHIDIKA